MPSPPDLVGHKPHFHRDEAWKQPVVAATTGAATLGTAFENGDTLDGVTLATGDRILIKNQSAGAENGIYIVPATGTPTRAYDMDTATEFVGAIVYVVAGTANGGKAFRCTNATPPTLETTAITWAELSASSVAASTVESETTFGLAPAVGTDTEYARQDHTHGSPANPVSGSAIGALGFVGQLLISDSPSTPLIFADLLQNEAQDDLLYADV